MAAIQNALSDELTSPVRLGKLRSIHIRTDAGLEEAVGSEGECTATKKRDSRTPLCATTSPTRDSGIEV
jgi:hypothetical protein